MPSQRWNITSTIDNQATDTSAHQVGCSLKDLEPNKSFPMHWILLILAGLFEVGFTTCLGKAKLATGNAALGWYAGFLCCLVASMTLLIKATQHLPLGTAYAVWTGIGAVGTALIGILFFRESADFWRIFFMVTLIGSIIGLKAVSS